MTDITGISQAFAAEFGFTSAFWGYVLGSATIVAVIIAVSWAVGRDTMIILISSAVALTLVVAIGWIDWWVVVFIGLVLALVLVFGNGVPSFGRGGGA